MPDLSAYSLQPWEMRVGLGLVGTTFDTVGASIPVEIGLPAGLQLGTNLAHDIGTVLNLDLKWNAVDVRRFGLGLKVGIKWANPSLMYFLSDEDRETYGDIDLLIVPVRIATTFPILSWLDAHLDVGYLHSSIIGDAEVGVEASAGIAYRELFIEPRLGFYPGGQVAIFLGAYLPVFAKVNGTTAVESEVEPGVITGYTATGFQKVDVKGLNTFYLHTEMRWGTTHLRLGIVQYLRFFNQRLEYPLPTMDLYWRF